MAKEIATVALEFCNEQENEYPFPLDQATRIYNNQVKNANLSADEEEDIHVVRVALMDDDVKLKEHRVQCRHQKPFN